MINLSAMSYKMVQIPTDRSHAASDVNVYAVYSLAYQLASAWIDILIDV